jgi:hypothetical protein
MDGPGIDCAATEVAAKIGASPIATVLQRKRPSRQGPASNRLFFTRNERVARLLLIFLNALFPQHRWRAYACRIDTEVGLVDNPSDEQKFHQGYRLGISNGARRWSMQEKRTRSDFEEAACSVDRREGPRFPSPNQWRSRPVTRPL